MSISTADHVRELFLRSKATYSVDEASRLLGIARREVKGWMEAGELEGTEGDHGVVVPWEELVSFGLGLWSQEVVEEALGAEVAEAIPELLRLDDLHARVPRMEIVAIEKLAEREGSSASSVLGRELLDFVSANSDWLSREVVGFADAFAWPYLTDDRASGPPEDGGGSAGGGRRESILLSAARDALLERHIYSIKDHF